jgi:hypothetical protein
VVPNIVDIVGSTKLNIKKPRKKEKMIGKIQVKNLNSPVNFRLSRVVVGSQNKSPKNMYPNQN